MRCCGRIGGAELLAGEEELPRNLPLFLLVYLSERALSLRADKDGSREARDSLMSPGLSPLCASFSLVFTFDPLNEGFLNHVHIVCGVEGWV